MGRNGTGRETGVQCHSSSSAADRREGVCGRTPEDSFFQGGSRPPRNGESILKAVVTGSPRVPSRESPERSDHQTCLDRTDSEVRLAPSPGRKEESGKRTKQDDAKGTMPSRDSQRGERAKNSDGEQNKSHTSPSSSPNAQDGEEGAAAASPGQSGGSGTLGRLPGEHSTLTSGGQSPVAALHRGRSLSASPCEKPQDNSTEAELSNLAHFQSTASSPSAGNSSSPSSSTSSGATRGATSALPRRTPPSTVLETSRSRVGAEADTRSVSTSSARLDSADSRISAGAATGSNKRERESGGGRAGESGKESRERVAKSSRTERRDEPGSTEEEDKADKEIFPTTVLRTPSRQKILSLEEMLIKQKIDEQPTRVVFMSKKQREQQKAEEERRQREQEKKKERQMLQARRNFLMHQEIEREKETKKRLKQREMEKIKEEQERRLREARGDTASSKPEETRNKADEDRAKKQAEGRMSGSGNKDGGSTLADLKLLNLPEQELRTKQQERELEQIRNHYLGMRTEKKKIQKPSEKFRNIFNFEWNDSEDTCKGDNNPLYQERMEPQLLFGRGFRAGMDIREQRKHNNFYDELVKRRQEQQRLEAARGAAEAATAAAAAATEAVRAAREAQKTRAREKDAEEESRGHWTTKKREDMTDRDWRIFREDFEIYIKGGRVPPPIRTWAESALPWELIEAVKRANYERPTPIQMQAIPIALEQRDLIGIAETGSGKTAAFVLPMLTYVKGLPPLNEETGQDGPYALILAPSRELALQIDEETQKFASFCKCRTVAVVGGRSAETQAFQLRRGAEIVIGTPGRVKDCLEKAYTVLNQCNYVVLDEADRMIDMGFEEIVNFILDQIPTTNLKSNDEALILQQEMQAKAGHRLFRLTQMFSATMPPAVERLARKYLRQPSYISIGDPGAGKRSIEQVVEFVPEARKKQRLQELLETATPPVMVFVNQKKSADALAKVLSKLGYSACSLHGGKAQENREAALSSFKEGSHDVLVATDVAGRGIDVEGVQLVVNFDMPKDIEAYTHRIGRTGRAGKKGLAVSFVTDDDCGIFYDLKQLLVSTNNIVPLDLMHHPASKAKGGDKNLVKPIWFN